MVCDGRGVRKQEPHEAQGLNEAPGCSEREGVWRYSARSSTWSRRVSALPGAHVDVRVTGEGGEAIMETPRWLVVLFLGTALVALVVLVLYFLV
jgi:hypothetical protein